MDFEVPGLNLAPFERGPLGGRALPPTTFLLIMALAGPCSTELPGLNLAPFERGPLGGRGSPLLLSS